MQPLAVLGSGGSGSSTLEDGSTTRTAVYMSSSCSSSTRTCAASMVTSRTDWLLLSICATDCAAYRHCVALSLCGTHVRLVNGTNTPPHSLSMSLTKLERDKQKLVQDKCQQILTELLRDEDNKYCVDCDSKGMYNAARAYSQLSSHSL